MEDLTDLILEGYLKLQKLTIAEHWKETQYKLMHRAYSTQLYKMENQEQIKSPEKAKKHKKNTTKDSTKERVVQPEGKTAKCPKCNHENPTLKHFMWTCQAIQTFG